MASRVEQGRQVHQGCLGQRGMEDLVSQASKVSWALREKMAPWDPKETQDLQEEMEFQDCQDKMVYLD